MSQKQRLKQRLTDLARGAYGGYSLTDFNDEHFGSMASELGLDAFGRWLGAIDRVFGNEHRSLVEPCMIEHYDTLDMATDYLWERGVRP